MATHAVAVLVVVLLATMPAWGPVALTAASGNAAGPALGAINGFISRYGGRLVVALLLMAGALLVIRGVLRTLEHWPG